MDWPEKRTVRKGHEGEEMMRMRNVDFILVETRSLAHATTRRINTRSPLVGLTALALFDTVEPLFISAMEGNVE